MYAILILGILLFSAGFVSSSYESATLVSTFSHPLSAVQYQASITFLIRNLRGPLVQQLIAVGGLFIEDPQYQELYPASFRVVVPRGVMSTAPPTADDNTDNTDDNTIKRARYNVSYINVI